MNHSRNNPRFINWDIFNGNILYVKRGFEYLHVSGLIWMQNILSHRLNHRYKIYIHNHTHTYVHSWGLRPVWITIIYIDRIGLICTFIFDRLEKNWRFAYYSVHRRVSVSPRARRRLVARGIFCVNSSYLRWRPCITSAHFMYFSDLFTKSAWIARQQKLPFPEPTHPVLLRT